MKEVPIEKMVNCVELREIMINRMVFIPSGDEGGLDNLTLHQLRDIGALLIDSLIEYYGRRK